MASRRWILAIDDVRDLLALMKVGGGSRWDGLRFFFYIKN